MLKNILRVFRAAGKSFFKEVNALLVSSNFVEVLQKTFLERILEPFSANAALYKLLIIDSY